MPHGQAVSSPLFISLWELGLRELAQYITLASVIVLRNFLVILDQTSGIFHNNL